MNINITRLEQVVKNFSATPVIRGVSLEGRSGELILLLGPSGSGKTTILTLCAGLLAPSSGTVFLYDRNIESYRNGQLQRLRSENIGFVFQNFNLIEALTVRENVMMPMRFLGVKKRKALTEADRLLSVLGIRDLAGRSPAVLSQGEKQRVAIARALANNPGLILADEPTANLESSQGMEVIRILHRCAESEDRCVLVASHDLRLKQFADRVIYVNDGRISPAQGEMITDENLNGMDIQIQDQGRAVEVV